MKPVVGTRQSTASLKERERVAVIGAGIVGLAHAWSAARRGHEVMLFERDPHARGASIRNFGMIWPIGQQHGRNYETALRSRALWLEFLESASVWHRECGSLHLAYRDDELAVLTEFADVAGDLGYACRMISPAEVARMSPAARRDPLGALWSDTEVGVDPRQVIATLPRWLAEQYGVRLHFGTAIERVAMPWVAAADGERWQVDRVIVATGADVRMLFPQVLQQSGFRQCKLQMLRTVRQPSRWQFGPMLAGGLTLRHYPTFGVCKSLEALKQRIAAEAPELDHYGIHVMGCQNGQGEIVLGDSHEYDQAIEPFDKAIIDELILRELRQLIDLPDWTIGERWHGIYAQLPGKLQFVHEVEPGVTIITGAGGCGMTMSFGLADETLEREGVGFRVSGVRSEVSTLSDT
jgi:D-hydroxyproline dehydrogenase subunit beta